jgi:hypothetical protein
LKSGLTEDELLFSKIIRDADKLDIFYISASSKYSMESIFWYKTWDAKKISEKIIKDIEETHYIYYKKIQNNADVVACFYAYIYDLYFPISLKIVAKNKYLETFTARVCQKFKSPIIHEQAKKLLESSNQYLSKF